MYRIIIALAFVFLGLGLLSCDDNPVDSGPTYELPEATTKAILVENIKQAYEDRESAAYLSQLADDFHYYCIQMESGQRRRVVGLDREQERQCAVNIFTGRPGRTSDTLVSGVTDILVDQFDLREWTALDQTDPLYETYPEAEHAIFDVEIIFSYQTADGDPATFTVSGDQIFYALPITQADESIRWKMLRQKEIIPFWEKANADMSWFSVKDLYTEIGEESIWEPAASDKNNMMARFRTAYDEMDLDAYAPLLHEDYQFRYMTYDESGQPTGNVDALTLEAELRCADNMFEGRMGENANGDLVGGITDITFDQFDVMEWIPINPDDSLYATYPRAEYAVSSISLIFAYTTCSGEPATFTVDGNQRFLVTPIFQADESESWVVLQQYDGYFDKARADHTWSGVKSLYLNSPTPD